MADGYDLGFCFEETHHVPLDNFFGSVLQIELVELNKSPARLLLYFIILWHNYIELYKSILFNQNEVEMGVETRAKCDQKEFLLNIEVS